MRFGQAFAAVFLAAAVLLGSCGEAPESRSEMQEEAPASSAGEPSAAVFRSVPEGEPAIVSYGIVLSASGSSVTVDLASASGEEEVLDAGALLATGVQKTVTVDENCPILDETGQALALTDLREGMAVQFIQTPSLLLSIQVLPEAGAGEDAAESGEPQE